MRQCWHLLEQILQASPEACVEDFEAGGRGYNMDARALERINDSIAVPVYMQFDTVKGRFSLIFGTHLDT